MKVLLIGFLVAVTLGGCAAGGGSASSTVTPTPNAPVVPGCKALNSVWTSTTDLERHDFTNVVHGVVAIDYEFRGATGQTCGFASNPSHMLNALVETPADYQLTGREWDYRLNLTYSLALGGDCATYGAGPLDTMQAAFIKVSCNAIQICKGTNDVAPFSCKTFN